jgi:uncharacterized protein
MNGQFFTYTGRLVHPMSPSPDEIDIHDIARSLANICRFLGHARRLYSVAQHSVLVSQLVPPADALWGLLHDASEAYLCDLPAPLKRLPEMEFYRIAEDRMLACVAMKFGLAPEMPASVKHADRVMLATEFRDVAGRSDRAWIAAECGVAPLEKNIFAWPPRFAEESFLARFEELTV